MEATARGAAAASARLGAAVRRRSSSAAGRAPLRPPLRTPGSATKPSGAHWVLQIQARQPRGSAVARAIADEVAAGAGSEAAPEQPPFEWLEHWYPVMWEADLLPGKPTKMTLFDEEYCLLRRPDTLGGATMCLRNACPHRLAALSEGRMTEQGFLQCAYHGWSFDDTGACVDLPTSAGGSISSRTCNQALPCEVVGGQVWVFPGALEGRQPAGPPPVLPEMMPDSGWRFTPFVRDFPVDYSVLVENITDPDHGLFAHQSVGFDFYTGSDKFPQQVEVLKDGAAFSVQSKVTSANKLTKRVQTAKEELPAVCVEKGPGGDAVPKISTTTFDAPCTITMARRGADGTAGFVACFWVVPVGLGRARFMSAALTNAAPFSIPRWLIALNVNNFLDQDTHLLGTAQALYLPWELECVQQRRKLDRRSFFRYQSPSENMLIAIGRFMDRALPSMPGRYTTRAINAAMGAGLAGGPVREQILDRWAQHTAICPDSQGVVAKAGLLAKAAAAALAVSVAALALKAVQAVSAQPYASVWQSCAAALAANKGWVALAVVAAAVAAAAAKLRAEFFFKYTEQLRDRDLARIPKVYPDTSIASS